MLNRAVLATFLATSALALGIDAAVARRMAQEMSLRISVQERGPVDTSDVDFGLSRTTAWCGKA